MIRKIWMLLRTPTAKYSMGLLLVVGFISGILFWGGFHTVVEATNTEEFCLSCHEMKENVYKEYKETIHYSNRTGVRAICSDCHVPKSWGPKMVRKIQASNELYHKIMGTVDTPEKFEKHRLTMANLKNDPEGPAEVMRLLNDLRMAWAKLDERERANAMAEMAKSPQKQPALESGSLRA